MVTIASDCTAAQMRGYTPADYPQGKCRFGCTHYERDWARCDFTHNGGDNQTVARHHP